MIKQIKEHRSIRRYKSEPIPEQVLKEILLAGTRASNTGNMQVYSMVITTKPELKERLMAPHHNQPWVRQAPVLITFCADINRFNKWCKLRGAEPHYDNFLWFINATIDVTLASQNIALQAEAHGLGVVYLGTTTYNAKEISEILELPKGVVPITTLVVGYPEGELPPLTDRLPVEAVVHSETYKDYSDQDIEELWREKEGSEETSNILKDNDLPNLARVFTERRYVEVDNIQFSKKYFEFIKEQGFFNQ